MTTPLPDMTASETSLEELKLHRQELLETARQLDHLGKRFERFMSLQLQKLEMTLDDFEREREAWRRQREREWAQLETLRQAGKDSTEKSTLPFAESRTKSKPDLEQDSYTMSDSSSAPLLILIEPGEASAMQLGLLLFEISKLSREFGGGGARFEVNTVRLPKGNGRQGKPGPIIGIEAFSYLPLLAYDGSPTRELVMWEQFKSKVLMSTMIDRGLLKEFKKAVKAPRDHESMTLAVESTRRAENANTKCEISEDRPLVGFFPTQKDDRPRQQQHQRIEDVFQYLQKEYGLRIHVSLVW